MSQDQDNLDLMEEGIAELEGEVSLETALAEEKAKEKAAKAAAKVAEKEAKTAQRAAAKQAKLDEKAAKAAEREAAKAAKAAPKPERQSQNGVKLPSPNTSAFAIWSLITSISNEKGELCKTSDLKEVIDKHSYIDKGGIESFINPANISPELWAYKKYHGFNS